MNASKILNFFVGKDVRNLEVTSYQDRFTYRSVIAYYCNLIGRGYYLAVTGGFEIDICVDKTNHYPEKSAFILSGKIHSNHIGGVCEMIISLYYKYGIIYISLTPQYQNITRSQQFDIAFNLDDYERVIYRMQSDVSYPPDFVTENEMTRHAFSYLANNRSSHFARERRLMYPERMDDWQYIAKYYEGSPYDNHYDQFYNDRLRDLELRDSYTTEYIERMPRLNMSDYLGYNRADS
jgi:hypothetical protein